jgi:hypothetical protein
VVIPEAVEGCDVRTLLRNLLPVLAPRGQARLRADLDRYASFIRLWPGADLQRLDDAALRLGPA